MHDIRVVPTKIGEKLFRLDIYIDGEHIGEYERSQEANIARKIQEVKSSSAYLRTLHKEHGQLQVRLDGDKKEKVVRSLDRKVGTIPREFWEKASWE